MKNTLDLGTHPRTYCHGSLRPLVTEVVLSLIPDGMMSQEQIEKLRESACALDPLWRDCMAALSVGSIEFSRFESERIRAAIAWKILFAETVEALLKAERATSAFMTVSGSTSEERLLAWAKGFRVEK